MLMDIKCSAVTSVRVALTFDDGSSKERVIGTGDLVDVEYNANGLRKRIEGKVLKVSAVGTDPRSWYIIVDSSDDFDSNKAKFSPMSILDVEIIRKADTLTVVQTIVGEGGIPYLRINKGRLQWSKDGEVWHSIRIDNRDIIEDQEGTVPIPPTGDDDNTEDTSENESGIEDANW